MKRYNSITSNRVILGSRSAQAQKNLEQHHDRLKGGTVSASPLWWIYIPEEGERQKADLDTSLEDKIVQTTVDLLNAY